MEQFIIKGGKSLEGIIEVRGAKNAALKAFAASLLSNKKWIIKNVPAIEDVSRMVELLSDLGVNISSNGQGDYEIKAAKLKKVKLREDLSEQLRASMVLTGPILAREGKVTFSYPGGCVIGRRPIDIFLDGFEALGAKITRDKSLFHLSTNRGKLRGNKFIFPRISVTATECLMLAAVLAKGKTILKNAACEPEIPALAQFLNKCGAKIKGAGTHTIEIEGVERLNGGTYKVIPDRLETGTFAILGIATNSRIKIAKCNPTHLEALWIALNKAGVNLELGKDYVITKPTKNLKSIDIVTHEYPGFATDFQAPFTVLMTQARGQSLIHEIIYEGRLLYAQILNQMGANIVVCDPHRIIVNGPSRLYGRRIISPDIRAGIALVVAALVAQGETRIENIYQIDRGYERIEERLAKLGANIKRVKN